MRNISARVSDARLEQAKKLYCITLIPAHGYDKRRTQCNMDMHG